MANVIYHNVNVSVVVGTDTAEVMTAPTNKSVMAQQFEDALGISAGSTRAVVAALKSGDIERPAQARERVKDQMGELFTRRRTGFDDLALEVQSLFQGESAPIASALYGMVEYAHLSPDMDPSRKTVEASTCEHIRERMRSSGRLAFNIAEGIDLRNIVIGSLISNIVTDLAVQPVTDAILGQR
jgi:hypothetical protein